MSRCRPECEALDERLLPSALAARHHPHPRRHHRPPALPLVTAVAALGLAWPAGQGTVTVGWQGLDATASAALAQAVYDFDTLPVGLKLADLGPVAGPGVADATVLAASLGGAALAESAPGLNATVSAIAPGGVTFVDYAFAEGNGYDLASVFRHELGLQAGLGESSAPEPYNDGRDCMATVLPPGTVRYYGPGDVLTLRALYGG